MGPLFRATLDFTQQHYRPAKSQLDDENHLACLSRCDSVNCKYWEVLNGLYRLSYFLCEVLVYKRDRHIYELLLICPWILLHLIFRPYKDRAGNLVTLLFLLSNLLGIISKFRGPYEENLQLSYFVAMLCTMTTVAKYMLTYFAAHMYDAFKSPTIYYSTFSSRERKFLAPVLWISACSAKYTLRFCKRLPPMCRAKSLSQQVEEAIEESERQKQEFHQQLSKLPVGEQLKQLREEYGSDSEEYKQQLEHAKTGGIAENYSGNLTKVRPVWLPPPPPPPPNANKKRKKKKKKKKKKKTASSGKDKKGSKRSSSKTGEGMSLDDPSSDDY